LLTLLIRLALAVTLLRLAFVVLIHSNSPKVAETSFECASLKQRPYMEMNREKHRGGRPLCQKNLACIDSAQIRQSPIWNLRNSPQTIARKCAKTVGPRLAHPRLLLLMCCRRTSLLWQPGSERLGAVEAEPLVSWR
jgi:hypothetical protein